MNSESENKNQGASTPSQGGAGNKEKEKEGKYKMIFSFNVNKKVDDKTEMTGEFISDVQHYYDYNQAVVQCFELVEACYMPVGGKANKKDESDAFQRMASALHEFKGHFAKSPHAATLDLFDTNMKAASVERKAHQKIQKYVCRHLRRFRPEDFPKFETQREAFDESRKRMDQAKTNVRDAKTTTEIEKKAICYQMAVDDFDAKTEQLIKMIDELPKLKQKNCNDILMFLTKHKDYHAGMIRFYKLA